MGVLPFDEAARMAPAGFSQRLSRPTRSDCAHTAKAARYAPADRLFTHPKLDVAAGPLPDRSAFALEIIGHLDIDLEGRDLVAALEPDDDLGRVQRDMPGHDGENFLTQHAEQIGLAAQSAFMGKQDLQPFARDGCGGLVATEKPKQTHAHAALRRSRRSMKPLRSAGTCIGTVSPHSRRAASI